MSLHYNVAQLLKSEIGQKRTYEFESPARIDLDEAVATDIHGHVKFTLTNFGILATVHADAELHLSCARCLEGFQSTTHIDFEEEYQPSIDIVSGKVSSVPSSDTAFIITQNHTVDLREAVRQNLVLAIELIPLCRDDCLGLCPSCGVNRNLESCSCPSSEGPSPFVVLRGLLVQTEAES